jgi:uncharacterized protein YecE (DUF72 family)
MRFYIGTSGFSYKEWKGPFYPKDMPDKEMLRFYSENLPAVEINNTFYRMPVTKLLEAWAEQTPPDFKFVLKAPRKITHMKPLKEKGEEIDYLFKTAAVLGDRLGPILFQLPPYLRKNTKLLADFLALLPTDAKAVFEFRHVSWFDDELYELLHNKGFALCCSDSENEELSRFVAVADRGYLRLRKPDYSEDELIDWAAKIKSQDWEAVYVFFKHEDAGAGPNLAEHFLDLLSMVEPPSGRTSRLVEAAVFPA